MVVNELHRTVHNNRLTVVAQNQSDAHGKITFKSDKAEPTADLMFAIVKTD